MQMLVRASVSLYEPRGDYQVIIETMQPAGDGLLQQRFDELKMKLAAAGLFSQEHKKSLPDFVKKVGGNIKQWGSIAGYFECAKSARSEFGSRYLSNPCARKRCRSGHCDDD